MPQSYQPHMRQDDQHPHSHSQTLETNFAAGTTRVHMILDRKGRDVATIHPDGTLHEAVELLRDRRIGALAVTDAAGALVGILSERDIIRRLADTPGTTLPQQVADVMTRSVETCGPDDALVSVLKRMSEGRFRHMPVIDGGALGGMISIGDVVNHRLVELEHETLQLKQLIVG